MSNKEYTLSYTTPEESEKFVELGFPKDSADKWHTILKTFKVAPENPINGCIIHQSSVNIPFPCWSLTRIVDILENNGIKVSYEDKSWCLKTNVIENGLRHCFVGNSLPKLVIEMLESKIVKLK